jgi:hypothetical protein
MGPFVTFAGIITLYRSHSVAPLYRDISELEIKAISELEGCCIAWDRAQLPDLRVLGFVDAFIEL